MQQASAEKATGKASARKQFLSRKHRDWLWAYVFIAPTVLGLYLFFVAPIFFSIYISLTRWNHLTSPVFIGFDNYARMLTDSILHTEIRNTFFYVLLYVPITVALSLLLAVVLTMKLPLLGFFRTTIFIPHVTLPAAAALVWMNMFNARFGFVNGALRHIGIPVVDWFGSANSVMGIIIAMGVWQAVGYFGVILMVGLKNLPLSYFEAARIDGANGIQAFFKITVPLLTPQLFFVSTIATIGAFGMFDGVFVFGRLSVTIRDSIRTMAFGIFDRGFSLQEMGYASANAVLLFALIMIVTVIQFIGQKYWVHYE